MIPGQLPASCPAQTRSTAVGPAGARGESFFRVGEGPELFYLFSRALLDLSPMVVFSFASVPWFPPAWGPPWPLRFLATPLRCSYPAGRFPWVVVFSLSRVYKNPVFVGSWPFSRIALMSPLPNRNSAGPPVPLKARATFQLYHRTLFCFSAPLDPAGMPAGGGLVEVYCQCWGSVLVRREPRRCCYWFGNTSTRVWEMRIVPVSRPRLPRFGSNPRLSFSCEEVPQTVLWRECKERTALVSARPELLDYAEFFRSLGRLKFSQQNCRARASGTPASPVRAQDKEGRGAGTGTESGGKETFLDPTVNCTTCLVYTRVRVRLAAGG